MAPGLIDAPPSASGSTSAAASQTPPPFQAARFALLTAMNFLFFLSYSLFFLLPRFVLDLGGSEDDIGALMTVGGVGSFLAIPLTGILVDRFSRRPFLIAGVAVMTLTNAGFNLVDHLGASLYLLRWLQGVAFALAFTAGGTLAVDLLPPRRRAQGLGIYGVATLLTHSIGPPVAEKLVRLSGFSAVFWLAAALAGVSLLLAALVREPEHERAAGDETDAGVSMWQVLTGTGIFFAIVLNFTCGSGFGALAFFMPTYVDRLGLAQVSPFFIAYSIAAATLRLTAGGLPDRFGHRWFVVPLAIGLVGALVFAGELAAIWQVAALGVIFGCSHALLYPTLNALVVDRVSELNATGKAMSLYIGGFNAGVTLSSLLYGLAAEHLGYRAMYRIAALVVLAGTIVYAASELTKRPPRTTTRA